MRPPITSSRVLLQQMLCRVALGWLSSCWQPAAMVATLALTSGGLLRPTVPVRLLLEAAWSFLSVCTLKIKGRGPKDLKNTQESENKKARNSQRRRRKHSAQIVPALLGPPVASLQRPCGAQCRRPVAASSSATGTSVMWSTAMASVVVWQCDPAVRAGPPPAAASPCPRRVLGPPRLLMLVPVLA